MKMCEWESEKEATDYLWSAGKITVGNGQIWVPDGCVFTQGMTDAINYLHDEHGYNMVVGEPE